MSKLNAETPDDTEFKSCGTVDDSFVPPVISYPFRNSKGKWEVDGLELDSEGDELYITSLLEFRDLMEGKEGISKGSNE